MSGSDYKQIGIGALHGTWNFGQQLTSIPLYAGFGVQSALKSVNYLSGYSSFKNDWNSFKTSHTAWHAAGERLMHRVIPGADFNSSYYQGTRANTAALLDGFSVAGGAVKGVKSIIGLASKPVQISMPTIKKLYRAESSYQGQLLNTHLTQIKKYGSQGYDQLQNNKIRYYGELKAPVERGTMIGRRRVREWDPETGLKRTWHETLDGNNKVRIVRPETNDGIKTHFVFDEDGNFIGTR